MKHKGFFITLEGNEGSGKGTLIRDLSNWLESKKYNVFLTREPGGTKIGEKIRSILVDKKNGEMHPMTELLLYIANRNQNINEYVKPKIGKGCIVLSDRCLDSSVAYQGAGRQIDLKIVHELNDIAIGEYLPDLTIILLVDPKTGLLRKVKQQTSEASIGDLDRIEEEKLEFHTRLYEQYKKLSKTHKRFCLIDTTTITPAEVLEKVKNLFSKKVFPKINII